MGSFFQDTWLGLVSVVKNFNPIIDVLDILVISYIIYKGIQLVRETRAEQLLKGILLILVLTLVAFLLDMKTLNFLMNNILQIGIFAIIVLFQPEIRRALERLGRARMGNVFTAEANRHAGEWEPVIPPESRAVLAVAGLDAVGRPIGETCHRPDRAAVLVDKPLDALVTAADAALLLTHPLGGRKGVPAGAAFRCVLNKADTPARRAAGEACAAQIRAMGFRAVLTAFREEERDGKCWF